jgi:hypothetical protein
MNFARSDIEGGLPGGVFRRKDSPFLWVRVRDTQGRTCCVSTGETDPRRAMEFRARLERMVSAAKDAAMREKEV